MIDGDYRRKIFGPNRIIKANMEHSAPANPPRVWRSSVFHTESQAIYRDSIRPRHPKLPKLEHGGPSPDIDFAHRSDAF